MPQEGWVFEIWQLILIIWHWVRGNPEVVFSGIGVMLLGAGFRTAVRRWRKFRVSTEDASAIFPESNIAGEYYTFRWSTTRKPMNEHSIIKGRIEISTRLHKRKFNVKYSDTICHSCRPITNGSLA